MSKNIALSIVVPLFNEEEVLPKLLSELLVVCDSIGEKYEVIFVDDGSVDRTPLLLKEAADKNPNFKVLRFSKNFGHQAAFNAGIDFASGDAVVTMDGDLQHPPSLIPEFIKHAQSGQDIVIGERIYNRQNSFAREVFGKTIYKILSAISGLEFKNSSDFALYNRQVVSVLKQMPEKERFLRGMVQWVGFNKKYIPYIAQERKAGKTKYNLRKLVGLVMSGVTSFSAFPLRISFWLGLLVFLVSVGLGVFVFLDHYLNPNPLAAGYATISLIILFLGSIQLMMLGVAGEYLYKMFHEVKGRPLYIVSGTCNIDKEKVEKSPYGIHNL